MGEGVLKRRLLNLKKKDFILAQVSQIKIMLIYNKVIKYLQFYFYSFLKYILFVPIHKRVIIEDLIAIQHFL